MSEVIMIIVIAACGQMGSGGSGCGVAVETVPFYTLEACERAKGAMFPPPAPDASYPEREGNWQPRRDIQCTETR